MRTLIADFVVTSRLKVYLVITLFILRYSSTPDILELVV